MYCDAQALKPPEIKMRIAGSMRAGSYVVRVAMVTDS